MSTSKNEKVLMHFKPMGKNQKMMVENWLKQDYVAEYWHGQGLQNTLDSIRKFVNGTETLFTLWIAYDKDTPFGYLMTSNIDPEKDKPYAKYCNKDTRAISLDLLIGHPQYLGRGLAHQMIKQLLLQEFSSMTDVFIDPGIGNSKAIHVYEKAGFEKREEFIPDWEPSSKCLLMQLKIKNLHER